MEKRQYLVGAFLACVLSHVGIEAAEFLPHNGIRFPQNPCTSCPYIGLCLQRSDLTEAALVRRPGADDFGLFDELTY